MATKFKVKLELTERELRIVGQVLGLGAGSYDRVATKEAERLSDVNCHAKDSIALQVACECRDFLGALGISFEQLADSTAVVRAKFKAGFLK